MEIATDEETISRHQLNPGFYAQSLIEVLNQNLAGENLAVSAASSFSQLKLRIEQMGPQIKAGRQSFYKWIVLGVISIGWLVGFSEALASIRIEKSISVNEVMCNQIQHEKIIENWLHIEKEANKCE